MKLNHLILVICTGILVGFSACKKDPFTEKDAIEAQKELLTLKNGYDLALKNIDLAIQKSADETAIAIAKLNNQAASDLSKQNALQELARMQAQLENDRKVLLWNDSVYRIINDKDDQRAALMSATGGYKNFDVLVKDNDGEIIAGANVRVLPANSTTFLNVTTNADGIARFSNLLVFPESNFYVTGPTSATKVYARSIIQYATLSGTKTATLYWYDKSKTAKLSGTAYAAINLTNDENELAGAGVLVTALNSLAAGTGAPASDKISIEFSTLSGADSKYSMDLPITTGSVGLGSYTVYASRSVTRYQKAFVNWEDGDNLYQTLPSITDSNLLRLRSGYSDEYYWWGATNYFLSLPDEDAEGYSMTLTDPWMLTAFLTAVAPAAIYEILGDGVHAPDGSVTYPYQDLTILSDDEEIGGLVMNVDNFILNNSWMYKAPSQDTEYWYDLPVDITTDSTNYNAYMALSQGDKDIIAQAYIADFILTGGNPTAVWTPALEYDTIPVPDTLAVDLVDLSGWWMDEAPELSVAIAADPDVDEDLSHGKLQNIFIEDGNDVGKFNIVAVLFAGPYADVSAMFTNREPNPSYNGTISYSGTAIDEVSLSGVTYPGFTGTFTKARTMNIYYGKYRDGADVTLQAWLAYTLDNENYYFPENPFALTAKSGNSKLKFPTADRFTKGRD